jgi:hypothetical protein
MYGVMVRTKHRTRNGDGVKREMRTDKIKDRRPAEVAKCENVL